MKDIEILIPIEQNEGNQQGLISIPSDPKALIIFAHGSGSGKNSPRNKYTSKILNENGFATVLTDLLTPEEQDTDTRSQKLVCKIPGIVLNKFNIGLLSSRLGAVTDWIVKNTEIKDLPIGYFGASTGAAAAAAAAAAAIETSTRNDLLHRIFAMVSRGGRPDLASAESIHKVKASTLLIVGGNDNKAILNLNKKVLDQLVSAKEKHMVVIPNAGHLFEEFGTIEKITLESVKWFSKNFSSNY